MAAWARCPKTSFYRRSAGRDRFDKRAASFDRVYVDPVDLVVIRTMPWREDKVQVLRWQLLKLDREAFEEGIRDEHAALLEAWSERVVNSVDPNSGTVTKAPLLDDLDVDAAGRDGLLDAIELLVNVSEATALVQQKVPRNDQALAGILFAFGVGSC